MRPDPSRCVAEVSQQLLLVVLVEPPFQSLNHAVVNVLPTSSSWLNLVERWFRELTDKAVRRGAFVSVADLIQAIEAFLGAWNEDPKPFVWTAQVEEIMAKIARAREKLEAIEPGRTQLRKRRGNEE